MSTSFQKFKKLHHQEKPLLIGNVWNSQSASIFEKLNFSAIATSSAAVAESLGYSDGEEMDFDEYLFVVKHIAHSTSLPLSVDLEAGYGKNPKEIVKNINQLHAIGIVGINLEDSKVRDGKRSIVDESVFAELVREITEELDSSKTEMFINVRCDTFLLGIPDALSVAQQRIKAYEKTGAHGLFFPCITKLEDIVAVTKSTSLPINVMCMPGLPDFNALSTAGVKRISMGNFLNKGVYQNLESSLTRILNDKKFDSLF